MKRLRTIDVLYHAIPLHYVPSLLRSGALFAQSVLAARSVLTERDVPAGIKPRSTAAEVPSGIRPRSTAARRDRMLGVSDYVHLSPTSYSPLLADKLRKGYPHALLVFDADAVLALPETALLPYNTKAWRTRACFAPVGEERERRAMIDRYIEGKRLQSLEVLVKYGLSLTHLRTIAFVVDRDRDAVASCVESDLLVVDPDLFPAVHDAGTNIGNWDAISRYFDLCRTAGSVPYPPVLPFD